MQRKKLALRMAKLECWLGTSSSTYIFVALYCATNYVLSRSYARETFLRRGDTDELNYNSHC